MKNVNNFSEDAYYPLTIDFVKERSSLSKEELKITLQKVSKILDNEPKLIQLPKSRIFFCGDTHGQFALTHHVMKHLFGLEKGINQNYSSNSSSKSRTSYPLSYFKRHSSSSSSQYSIHSKFDYVVFLGDFIDRGPFSIENVNFLMSMKALYPEKVILIRGNHETREINRRFDFYEAVVRRYGIDIFELYNRIFSKLPLAVLTWNNIFAVHGGIPEGLEHISDINGLEDSIDPLNKITFQLLWNDPVEKDGWFFKNFRGKFSKKFGQRAFEHFIKKNNINLIIRAHESQKKGYKFFFRTKLLSIDSSSKILGKPKMKFVILEKNGEYRIEEIQNFDKKITNIFS